MKEKLLTIAIAIILTMFIFYGISTFYPKPEWDDMCKDVGKSMNEADCVAANGEWSYYEGRPRPVKLEAEEEYDPGYCECSVYDNAREARSRTVFIIAVMLGLVAVLLGTIAITLPSVGSGVMAGGILTVISGTMQYWGDLPDYARFIALGVALTILIVLAYKKLNK